MTTKHTPGPWEVGPDRRPAAGSLDVNHRDMWIASVNGSHRDEIGLPPVANFPDDKTCEANARLIAAAPELLAALDELMKLESRGRIMPIGAEWDAARAALSRAKGTT